MESVLRKLKLIKPNSKEEEARRQLLNELFSYKKGLVHGLPHEPSSMALDPKLGFLAIGSEDGTLRVYGRSGVQFTAEQPNSSSVEKIFFLEEQARLITLSKDRSIYKWEMNVTSDGHPSLTVVASFLPHDNEKIEKWVACLTLNSADLLFAANQVGDIHVLDVETFQLREEEAVKQEDLLKIASEEQKSKGTSIKCIAQQPAAENCFLIGYQEGIMICWNGKEKRAERCFGTNQPLEWASFNRCGSEIVTSHADGSHMTWNVEDILKHVENATTPYGPFACKEITKIVTKSTSKISNSQFLIFCGGMPKSNFGDKNTVTVMHSNKHVVFDLRSRVVDFVVMCEADEKDGDSNLNVPDNPHTLLILTTEELVVVDLSSENWSLLNPVQVSQIHDSPVSCLAHYPLVPQNVWIKIDFVRRKTAKCQFKDWTLKGGMVTSSDKDHADLLLTGHENGDVVFWQSSATGLKKIFSWSTGDAFENSGKWGEDTQPETVDDNWPPFRKVNYSSPKYDDPRLSVTKIAFCPETGYLAVGGSSGQVLLTSLNNQDNKSLPDEAVFVDLLGKGPHSESLVLKRKTSEARQLDFGLLSISCALQIDGIHPCSDLALKSDWQLVAVGTSNGFVLFDYLKKKAVLGKCTVVTGGRGSVSRSRSFQQSLRESLRGIKKKPAPAPKSPEEVPQKGVVEKVEDAVEEVVAEVEGLAKNVQEKVVNGIENGMEKLGLKDEKEQKTTPQPEAGESVKVLAQEIKEHKIEQLTPSKKSEVITTITTTNVSTTTTTVKNEDGEEIRAEKPTEESVVNGAEDDGKKVEESKKAEEGQAESQSRGSTLKRDGVTFDTTPSRAVFSSSSSVSCVKLIGTCLSRSNSSTSPTLWVGLSDGKIFAYQLVVPQGTSREQEDVSAVLAKEIHLKHGAPVCNLLVIDDKGKQVGGPVVESTNGQPAETSTSNHRLVVCSWEQIKIFSLPGLKAQNKHKLLKNHDEGRICAVTIQNFKSKSDESYSENAMVCITSAGDVSIVSLPSLKFRVKIPAIQLATTDRDLIGQCWFLSNGVAVYRSSEEELESFSLSTFHRALPQFSLPLKEGMRVVPAVEEPAAGPEEEVMVVQEGETSPVHEPAKVVASNGGAKVGCETVEQKDVESEKIAEPTVTITKEEKTSDNGVGTTTTTTTHTTFTSGGSTEEAEKKKPKEIILDVKKYSTTTTTTTTIQNESSDAAELLEDSVKCHLGEGDEDTVMVMTTHDVIENKMVIKTTLHTITDPQGISTETKTVVKETASTCIESNFQDGNPVPGDGTSVN